MQMLDSIQKKKKKKNNSNLCSSKRSSLVCTDSCYCKDYEKYDYINYCKGPEIDDEDEI